MRHLANLWCRVMTVFQLFKIAVGNEILTAEPVRGANMHQRATFRVNCVNRCRDKTVFRIFKMAEVCHLGFLKVQYLT